MLTVVIPTYNSEHRISIALNALASQELESKYWELIVVDNASTDQTVVRVEQSDAFQRLRAKNVACRVVTESRQGATFARVRGVSEAQGEVICFLDDDCEPLADYLMTGSKIFGADPEVGLLVSRVEPAFEVPPPPAIERRRHLLAINDYLGTKPLWWPRDASVAPTIGAGLWILASAFKASISDNAHLLPDRTGASLACGGDIEFGVLVGRAGFKRGYRPEMLLKHHIPARRFDTRYFCKLIDGIARSDATLQARYGLRHEGRSARISAAIQLVICIVAAPIIILRKDGYREFKFVYTYKLAQLRGPYDSASYQ